MTGQELPLVGDAGIEAERGSWCPKMCSHACPVLRATGRPDAVPWSFHRTVADLAVGRLTPSAAADRLVACTGCGACAGACEVEGQDVPAQVVAARVAVHAAGAADPAVDRAVEAVAAGRSPYGTAVDGMQSLRTGRTVVWAGCRDEPQVVSAATRVLTQLGDAPTVTGPDGCCGAALRDLGAASAADAEAARAAESLAGAETVVVLDPHCRDEVAAAAPHAEVVDLVEVLARSPEAFRDLAGGEAVTWHEPCLLRGGDAQGMGPDVLARAGALVGLPSGAHPACSGGGMGLPLLDPAAADAVAADLVARLGAGGDTPVVTACSGAVVRLASVGAEAVHLAVLLARMLDEDPKDVA